MAASQPRLKLPRFYKTLLILALVIGPFYWLTFTDDGRRRTDLALLAVLGKPAFNAALAEFDSGLTEARLRETFPKLGWQCTDRPTTYGDRLCTADIASFNQIPARTVVLFLDDGHLRVVRVDYRRAYHDAVRDWVMRHAQAAEDAATPAGMAAGVLVRRGRGGMLVMREGRLAADEAAALMWLSRQALNAGQADATRR